MNVRELIESREVVVCCGSGGVGKTTTSAALALAAASLGRRVAVLTIDPAKRLADALGIDSLDNEPTVIRGDWPGTLAALSLDTKATFDAVIRRHARNESQATQILNNRLYGKISSNLSGTQDYMAIEKLSDLKTSGKWDLVVIDTPPSQDALTFFKAPKLLAQLLDNVIFKLLVSPQRGVLRAANRATGALTRQLSRIVGADVMDDTIEFFQSFQGMEHGFQKRANTMLALLQANETAFILITSPRTDTLSETTQFLKQLRKLDLFAAAIVVNRMLPPLTTSPETAEQLRKQLRHGKSSGIGIALADHANAATGAEERIAKLANFAPNAEIARVPLLTKDVHDVKTLNEVARILTK